MVVLGETFYEQQTRDTLVALCKSQHIDYASKNKSELVAALMQWEAALDHSQSPEAADASTSEHGAAAEVQPLNAGPVSNPGELDPHLQAALKEFPADDHEGRRQLIQQYQERAEARAEREAERAEREAQRAEREAQAQREHQLQMARLQMQGSSQSSREPSSAQTPKPRPDHFPVMEKDGDLDTFLRAFEKACRQYQLPAQEWARYLTPGLRGKALEAFAALPQEQDGDYEAIKQALIAKYQLTPEVYRKKFRTLQRGPHDSYSDVVHGLGTHFDQWTQGLSVTTFAQLRDLMIKDQFFRLCPTEVRQFVMDREPKDVTKAAQIADAYEANRRSEVRKPVTTSWRGGKPAANASTPASQHTRGPVPVANSTRPTTELRQCYHCRQTGHLSHQCPVRQKNPSSQAPGPNAAVLLVGGVAGRGCDNVQPVTVGGRVATGLKDTGAERTLIRPELAAPEEIIPGKTLTVTGIGGISCPLPMARVFIDWGAGSGVKEVGLSDNLPTDVLLGTDLGRLVAYFVDDPPPQSTNEGKANPDDDDDDGKSHVLPDHALSCNDASVNHFFPRIDGENVVPVPTVPDNDVSMKVDVSVGTGVLSHVALRSETAEEPLAGASVGATRNGEIHGNREQGDAMQLTSATEEGNWPISSNAPEVMGVDGEVEPIAASADGSVETPGETAYVAAVTRSQSARNADNCLPPGPSSVISMTEPEVDPEQVPEGSRGEGTLTSLLASPSQEFQAALHTDASLESLRQLAGTRFSETDKEKVFWEGGRLYRETVPGESQKEWLRERQLVVPQQFRGELLRIAHEIPLAGHLGISKTKARLSQHFYWPKMGTDVSNYCRSCVTCQRVGKAGPALKAPLIPLPVIEEPFQRIAVDIVGPLAVTSSSGKQYILTVVDYATRYPEAVALSSTRADKVADALLAIFSRVGFPREMLTDRGTQFMSHLMEALCKKMQVKHLVSSAYHPQTNGLCERFNGTLKQMLRMLVETQGRDWERYLPHLLFAYREVPQASTGFSPFELLYGRRVRGPLGLVRESWEEEPNPSEVSIVEYVMRFRDKMQTLTQLVHDNMTQAQADQKHWYDQNARERTYHVGQKVWVLVPVPMDKLQAAWEGPYVVHQQLNPVTYVVTLDHTRGRRKAFHVNMMKAHHEREPFVLPVCSAPEEGEEDALLDMLAQAKARGSIEDVEVSASLDEPQRLQLQTMLEPFRVVFSNRPGRTELAVHEVDTGNHAPLRRTPYRISDQVQQIMRQEIDEMLQLGVIRRSKSAWASPVVLVPKKDRTTRFCVDYRGLNAITASDAHPMPRIEELLEKLAGAKYLTIMDLSRGYWQIPLSPEAQEKSAFITPFGLYESTVMPFGMKNAPATFQRMVNLLLQGLEKYAVAYLDDIAIFSPSWDEHLQHLEEVLGRIHRAGLTIKPGKCQMGMREVHYLGHRVGGGTLKPEPDKVGVIVNWPTPRNKKQVMSFLGTAGYYRRFVQHYSSLAKPLTDLTRKKLPHIVNWTDGCEGAFQALKTALCNAPVLKAVDSSRPFLVQTDASEFGLGAVLSQVDSEDQEHPVLYLSRKLLPREVAYSTIEKECLAIVWALQRLQPYLYGRTFTVVTDHNPLRWLSTMCGTNGRLLRWSLALQQFDFTIKHKAGKEHGNADGLSRQGEPTEVRMEAYREVLPP